MVAVSGAARAPIRWSAGVSGEPFVAMLMSGGGETTVSVNERLATRPEHHETIARWVARNGGAAFALLDESALSGL